MATNARLAELWKYLQTGGPIAISRDKLFHLIREPRILTSANRLDLPTKSVYTHIMGELKNKHLAAELSVVARDNCLCNHLRKADRVIRQIYDEAFRPFGLKATQFTLLNAIRLRGPIKQTDLAECTVTDRTTLTRNLASLQRQGLVQLQPGTDRRVKEISLTPAGHECLMEIYPHWQQAQAKTEELLGKQNVQQLLAELSDITRKLGGG